MTGRFVDISRDLQARLRKFFDTQLDAAAPPLEIVLAILDDVERHVQPAGRGRRVFPYTRLVVRIQRSGPERAPFESVCEGLDQKIRERLQELRCEAPRSLDVAIAYLDAPAAGWRPGQLFAIDYVRERRPAAAAPLPAPAALPSVHVVVLKGATTEPTYNFTESVISIGRSEDPTDALGRVRRNRVVFRDVVDGVTETVGRAHARLRLDADTREYLLFDDGSSNGTAIIRGGETIAVRARDPRGVRVQSGDEVQVGRAVIKLLVGAAASQEPVDECAEK